LGVQSTPGFQPDSLEHRRRGTDVAPAAGHQRSASHMSDWLFGRARRPLNISHRGGVDVYGPDLFDAVSRSVAAGADAIEVDVQATKDRELVVFHDRFLPTPTGLRRLDSLTLAEAQSVGVGTKAGLPLLRDVLRHAGSVGVPVLIDLKSKEAIEHVIAVVTRERLRDRVALASFHYQPLVALAAVDTSIAPVATIGPSRAMSDLRGFFWTVYAMSFPVHAARVVKARALLCRARRLSARLVDSAHAEGLSILAWDVTPSSDLDRLVTWGVDGIVATDALAVRTALEASRTRVGVADD